MDKDKLILYRKRLIPDECILLKDDIILDCTEDMIITKWNALKPKANLHHGYSCYLLNKGIKVSKFLLEDESLRYWYCDIVDYKYDKQTNTLTSTDLLADVIVYPDGFVKVVDLDELACAIEKKLCTEEQILTALKNLDWLLHLIYDDKFDHITECIEKYSRNIF